MADLRSMILEADDLASEPVEVPEWGVTVEVRAMDGKTRARFLKNSTGRDGKVDIERFSADAVIATTYDPESGDPVFTMADRDALLGKSGRALDRVTRVALRLSGMDRESTDEAVEDFDEAQS
jgi:hypothetical protein